MKIVDRTDKSEHPRCSQCGSGEPEHGFTKKNVIHRGYDHDRGKQIVQTSIFTVCKNTACGGHLQMAYEG